MSNEPAKLHLKDDERPLQGKARCFPEKVLIISDEHRAAKITNFPAYQASIIAKMAEYDHVVELGDNVELFYIKDSHQKDFMRMLDVLSGKGEAHWHKALKVSEKGNYGKVKSVIRGETMFLREFLEKFPHVTVHKVLGNHENVTKFRSKLDKLQNEYANFEWSPEAIRIGDGLFTHAHLQMSGRTDAAHPQLRLREAEVEGRKWRELYAACERPGYALAKVFRSPKNAVGYMHDQLSSWDKAGGFHFVHEKSKPIDFSMDWVKHVFFGHTHVKFDHRDRNGKPGEPGGDNVLYHNTGAVVEVTSKQAEDLGILEAELQADGSLRNIRPVQIKKDSKSFAVR
jgi:predicted phosphodiesterase